MPKKIWDDEPMGENNETMQAVKKEASK